MGECQKGLATATVFWFRTAVLIGEGATWFVRLPETDDEGGSFWPTVEDGQRGLDKGGNGSGGGFDPLGGGLFTPRRP